MLRILVMGMFPVLVICFGLQTNISTDPGDAYSDFYSDSDDQPLFGASSVVTADDPEAAAIKDSINSLRNGLAEMGVGRAMEAEARRRAKHYAALMPAAVLPSKSLSSLSTRAKLEIADSYASSFTYKSTGTFGKSMSKASLRSSQTGLKAILKKGAKSSAGNLAGGALVSYGAGILGEFIFGEIATNCCECVDQDPGFKSYCCECSKPRSQATVDDAVKWGGILGSTAGAVAFGAATGGPIGFAAALAVSATFLVLDETGATDEGMKIFNKEIAPVIAPFMSWNDPVMQGVAQQLLKWVDERNPDNSVAEARMANAYLADREDKVLKKGCVHKETYGGILCKLPLCKAYRTEDICESCKNLGSKKRCHLIRPNIIPYDDGPDKMTNYKDRLRARPKYKDQTTGEYAFHDLAYGVEIPKETGDFSWERIKGACQTNAVLNHQIPGDFLQHFAGDFVIRSSFTPLSFLEMSGLAFYFDIDDDDEHYRVFDLAYQKSCPDKKYAWGRESNHTDQILTNNAVFDADMVRISKDVAQRSTQIQSGVDVQYIFENSEIVANKLGGDYKNKPTPEAYRAKLEQLNQKKTACG